MKEIVDRDEAIEREVWARDEAVEFFRDMGEEYKAEIIASIPANENITLYRQGEFIDLCRGPHLPSTGKLGKAFKLTHVSGAAVNPVPGTSIEGERVGFQAYHRGRWDLFVADADQGENVGTSEPVADEVVLAPFVPAVSITIDPENVEKRGVATLRTQSRFERRGVPRNGRTSPPGPASA